MNRHDSLLLPPAPHILELDHLKFLGMFELVVSESFCYFGNSIYVVLVSSAADMVSATKMFMVASLTSKLRPILATS